MLENMFASEFNGFPLLLSYRFFARRLPVSSRVEKDRESRLFNRIEERMHFMHAAAAAASTEWP